MTPEPWFESVAADVPLTQGDLVTDCPILGWLPGVVPTIPPGTIDLKGLVEVALYNVVVMT